MPILRQKQKISFPADKTKAPYRYDTELHFPLVEMARLELASKQCPTSQRLQLSLSEIH